MKYSSLNGEIWQPHKEIPRKWEEAPNQVKMICIDLILRRETKRWGVREREKEKEKEREGGRKREGERREGVRERERVRELSCEKPLRQDSNTENSHISNVCLIGLWLYSVRNRPPKQRYRQ